MAPRIMFHLTAEEIEGLRAHCEAKRAEWLARDAVATPNDQFNWIWRWVLEEKALNQPADARDYLAAVNCAFLLRADWIEWPASEMGRFHAQHVLRVCQLEDRNAQARARYAAKKAAAAAAQPIAALADDEPRNNHD